MRCFNYLWVLLFIDLLPVYFSLIVALLKTELGTQISTLNQDKWILIKMFHYFPFYSLIAPKILREALSSL